MKIFDWAVAISGDEQAECDICLIGSHARGDASPMSDLDLVMFCDADPHLGRTESMHADETLATMFSVNTKRLLESEAVDFYAASNPFEARLVHGKGRVLQRLRTEIHGKTIDLQATKMLIAKALSFRLMTALGDAILDYGEGVRDMRVCLAKAQLYGKLFEERVEPWSIIPYAYAPRNELDVLLEGLYRSASYEELSDRIALLDLGSHLGTSFGANSDAMERIADRESERLRFAGRHVNNYLRLFLLVEEVVRHRVWRDLPGRWALEGEFSDVNHESTHIACDQGWVEWVVFIGTGESGRLERYRRTEH